MSVSYSTAPAAGGVVAALQPLSALPARRQATVLRPPRRRFSPLRRPLPPNSALSVDLLCSAVGVHAVSPAVSGSGGSRGASCPRKRPPASVRPLSDGETPLVLPVGVYVSNRAALVSSSGRSRIRVPGSATDSDRGCQTASAVRIRSRPSTRRRLRACPPVERLHALVGRRRRNPHLVGERERDVPRQLWPERARAADASSPACSRWRRCAVPSRDRDVPDEFRCGSCACESPWQHGRRLVIDSRTYRHG